MTELSMTHMGVLETLEPSCKLFIKKNMDVRPGMGIWGTGRVQKYGFPGDPSERDGTVHMKTRRDGTGRDHLKIRRDKMGPVLPKLDRVTTTQKKLTGRDGTWSQ